jgi:hypothetical protein
LLVAISVIVNNLCALILSPIRISTIISNLNWRLIMRRSVSIFVLGMVIGAAVLWMTTRTPDNGRVKPGATQAPANLKVVINAPDPYRPGNRRFYSLRVVRSVRVGSAPVVYDPASFDPETPGDTDWIVDVDGNAYWATAKP